MSSENDYTKDSKKWPKTPGKDWQYKQEQEVARGSRKTGGGARGTKGERNKVNAKIT